ncbi:MAG: BrnA antitoxin family protein [Euryarchaeota archaeon]|nr:BrnA antitoxin family protein [Euryarchaeota archaeon]MBU4222181.1 BrnA antitoxin family protein [Euryarchaeota archaeon]MCG2738470.1 BrnA antitoxin family protein [Candidatus Methanoperedenaceae archaeon]
MPKKLKKIPEEFKTYEEAADFWDTHDSTDYLNNLEEIEMEVDVQKRHFLLEVDMQIAKRLQESARKKGISASSLANELLYKQLAEAV